MEDKLRDVSVRLSSCFVFVLKDVFNCENSLTWVIEEWMCTQHSWIDTEGVDRRSRKQPDPVAFHAPPIARGHAALAKTSLCFISQSQAGRQHVVWQADRDRRSGSQEIPRFKEFEDSFLSLYSVLGHLNAPSVFSFDSLLLMLFILLQWNTVSQGEDVQGLNMFGMRWVLIEWTRHTRGRETWRKYTTRNT
jgi:hypothetical protein